jgi:hypothetical protein
MSIFHSTLSTDIRENGIHTTRAMKEFNNKMAQIHAMY